jgi:hypothetical protein
MPPRRLIAFRAQLRQINLETQNPTSFTVATWQRHLAQNPNLAGLANAFPNPIGRRDVLNIAHGLPAENPQWIKLFLACMVWGFTRGRDVKRIAAVCNHPGFEDSLAGAVHHLREEPAHLTEAYNQLAAIPGCKAGTFTKFLYFVGLRFGIKPSPLIFDSRVDGNIKYLIEDEHLDADTYGPNAGGYARYVKDVNDWATQLPCEPDAIELLLFEPRYTFWLWQAP